MGLWILIVEQIPHGPPLASVPVGALDMLALVVPQK